MKKSFTRILKAVSLLLVMVLLIETVPSSLSTMVAAEESAWAEELYGVATASHAYDLWDSKVANVEKNYSKEMTMLEADAAAAGVAVKQLGKDDIRLAVMYTIAMHASKELNDNDVTNRIVNAYNNSDVLELMKIYAEMIPTRQYASLKSLYDFANAYIVVKNKPLGGSHYAYTEGLIDDNTPAGRESNFRPGSQLVLVTLKETSGGLETEETVLLDLPDGVIRDPDVSTDGTTVLFSMKKNETDNFHLYEMDLTTKAVRQLTSGDDVSDIEGSYLPNGNIVFQSTRCVQTVDCWFTPVSNLYICDKDGGNIRRVGYDQVHTSYTSLTEDGRVIYTRWDYNDRNQMYVQGLFQMNPDGTNQTELFGNNSSFPTTLLHARQIPGSSSKYVAIGSGHHTWQGGKLVVVDVSKGRNSAEAVTYPFPEDGTDYRDNIDTQNQSGAIYRYPYAISDTQFLVSYCEDGWSGSRERTPFGIYYMTTSGTKVLLVGGSEDLPASQIVPIKNRELFDHGSMVNYSKTTGTYYIGNVYEGESMEGVEKGTAKYLRVVALSFRSGAIGSNNSSNPSIAAGGTAYTPVASANGTWDVKQPLGVVTIADDGSCLFEVPSETPLYFQVLNEDYELIATMRSWSTLQPNEYYSCVGCHEDNNTVPPASATRTQAMKGGIQKIVPESWMTAENGYEAYDPYTQKIGFSYDKVVQPILDKSCVSCHNNTAVGKALVEGGLSYKNLNKADLSQYLTAYNSVEQRDLVDMDTLIDTKASGWKYTFTDPGDAWFNETGDGWSTGQAPFGDDGESNTKWSGSNMEIWLTNEFTATASQADKMVRIRLFNDEDVEIYLNGEKIYSAAGYVTSYHIYEIVGLKLKAGKNRISIHVKQTGGGRKIDCGIYVSQTQKAEQVQGNVSAGLFSLEGTDLLGNAEKRYFSLSYLVLTQTVRSGSEFKAPASNSWTNWTSCQSPCEVQKPYSAGSSKSGLIDLLQSGHGNLTVDEIRAIETWIDLSIPYAGTYDENNNWDSGAMKYYQERQAKRDKYDQLDREVKNNLAS